MMWVLDYQDAIVSDLSRFHRVSPSDVPRMLCRDYMLLAHYLPSYEGAVFKLHEYLEEQAEKRDPASIAHQKGRQTGQHVQELSAADMLQATSDSNMF